MYIRYGYSVEIGTPKESKRAQKGKLVWLVVYTDERGGFKFVVKFYWNKILP